MAPDVRLGPNVKLEDVRLQSTPFDDGFGDEAEGGDEEKADATPSDTARFGEKSLAFEFCEEVDDTEDEDEDQDVLEDKWGGLAEDGCFSDGFVSDVEDEDAESNASDVVDGGGADEVDGGEFFFRLVLFIYSNMYIDRNKKK